MNKSTNKTRLKGPVTFVDTRRIIEEFAIEATTFCELEIYNTRDNNYKISLSAEHGVCLYNKQEVLFRGSIDEAETVILLAGSLLHDNWLITPITTKVRFTYQQHVVELYFGSGIGDWYEINGPHALDIAKEFNLPRWNKAEFDELALHAWKDAKPQQLVKGRGVSKKFRSLINQIRSVEYNVSLKRIKNRLVNYDNDFTSVEVAYRTSTGEDLLAQAPASRTSIRSSVSVIIPYYNTGEGVVEALRSLDQQWIDRQSYQYIQVVIVDDGSSTSMRLPSISSQDYKFTLKVVRHSYNKGRSAARNTGFSYATGDTIIFLDADCVPHPSFIGEHWKRNNSCRNTLFIGLKHDVMTSDEIPPSKKPFFSYCNDYRKYKNIGSDWIADKRIADWAHGNQRSLQIENGEYRIMETTNNLKDFSNYGWYGWWDLASVVVSHSISMRRPLLQSIGGFSYSFRGWGYEDAFFGACAIALGAYVVPVLNTGVYHLEHEARSGSQSKKRGEKMQNELVYAKLLDMRVSELNPTYMYS